jgi:hypothetical protein
MYNIPHLRNVDRYLLKFINLKKMIYLYIIVFIVSGIIGYFRSKEKMYTRYSGDGNPGNLVKSAVWGGALITALVCTGLSYLIFSFKI